MIAAETKKIAKYQPYPEYKDSGVDFLGSIPAHWQVAILKYECKFSGGGTPAKDNPTYWGGDIPWVSPKDMKSSSIFDSIDKITSVAVAESSTKMIPVGSLLMVVRSGILQRTIPVAMNTVPVTLNQDMKAIQFCAKEKSKYFFYYVQGLEPQLLQEWCKQGATVESIEHEFLANSRYPTPPDGEINLINQFLDYETARIDRLIAKQQQLIELLKEKRQAVISHAVTKGLNPNAPMKDSGVEWLGQVPGHWEVKKLFHLVDESRQIMYGIVLPGPNVDEGVMIVKGGDVKPGRLCSSQLCRTTPEIEAKYVRSRLRAGDLVYSIRGTIGDVEIVPKEIEGANLTQDAARIAPAAGYSNQWLKYVMESSSTFCQLEVGSLGAAVKGINIRDLKKVYIPVPPEKERLELESYISTNLNKLHELQKYALRQVELLKEHRTALISAAVTGKIDLRGWISPAEEVAA